MAAAVSALSYVFYYMKLRLALRIYLAVVNCIPVGPVHLFKGRLKFGLKHHVWAICMLASNRAASILLL
jgi:hypothetical protein